MPNPNRGPFQHEITVRALADEAWAAPFHVRADGTRGRLYIVRCPRPPGTDSGAFQFLISEPYVGILGPGTRDLAWVQGWDGDAVFLPVDSTTAWGVPAEKLSEYVKE